MDDVLRWWMPRRRAAAEDSAPTTGATTRFGGDGGDEPVLIGIVNGPVEIEMAKDALATAGIPAYIKQNSLGPVYGLSIGSFGTAEVWVMPVLAEQARDTLIGIGVLKSSGDDAPDPVE